MDSFPTVRVLESGHVSFGCAELEWRPGPYDQDAPLPEPPSQIIASGGLCTPLTRPSPFDWAAQ